MSVGTIKCLAMGRVIVLDHVIVPWQWWIKVIVLHSRRWSMYLQRLSQNSVTWWKRRTGFRSSAQGLVNDCCQRLYISVNNSKRKEFNGIDVSSRLCYKTHLTVVKCTVDTIGHIKLVIFLTCRDVLALLSEMSPQSWTCGTYETSTWNYSSMTFWN